MRKKLPNQSNSKRVALSVPPYLNDILEDLADLQGIPKTRVILSLLEEMQPQLTSFRDALKAAKEGQDPNKIISNMIANSLSDLSEMMKGDNK